MTLENAIKHLNETLEDPNHDWSCESCKDEHRQLLAWLLELQSLRAQAEAERNEPLTLEELREMAYAGLSVWCVDTDETAQGLLCMRDDWNGPRKSTHVCFLDEEENPGVYSVEYMLEFGAKFYRRRPKEE